MNEYEHNIPYLEEDTGGSNKRSFLNIDLPTAFFIPNTATCMCYLINKYITR